MPPAGAIACAWLGTSCRCSSCCCSIIFGSLRHARCVRRKPILSRRPRLEVARTKNRGSARVCVYLTALTARLSCAQASLATYQKLSEGRKLAHEGGRGGCGAHLHAGTTAPQHFLYFLPLPHGHGSFRPTLGP